MAKTRGLFILFGLGLGLALIWILGVRDGPVMAAPGPSADGTPAVEGERAEGDAKAINAPVAELHVCLSGCAYSSVQAAVDGAGNGDVIKVATGVYTGVQGRAAPAGYDGPSVITQVVYISKTITIRGGYTPDFVGPPDPEANPTTLDGQGQGRVLLIAGDPSAGQTITATVEGLRVSGGNARGMGGAPFGAGVGGGVYAVSATITISHARVFSNTADSGGGLWFWESDATLGANIVTDNGAADGGGGLYLRESDASLSGNTIASNTADSGGGLYLYESGVSLNGNTIAGNTAGSGGGLYLDESHGTLSGNIITGNIADTAGGLYLFGGDVTVNDNIITGNAAEWGGGGLYLLDSNGTVSRNQIIANTAASYGGGLYLDWASEATIINNIIANGTAGSGGGLYLYGSDATLSGNTLIGNTAEWDGGGLWLVESDATLINNVIADNGANERGCGLYIEDSSPRLLHTTIARNTCGGGGVYITGHSWDPSTVALTNTILASHSVGISVTTGSSITVNGVLWHNIPVTVSPSVTPLVKVQNQHTGTPVFVDADVGDYHIGFGSAAIDAGVEAGVNHDIDREPRPLGSGCDLGADEAGLFVTKQATPDPVRPGGPLTYTIRVTNATDVKLHAMVTDTLPLSVMLGETSGGTLALPGGTTFLPDGRVAATWMAVITAPRGTWMGTVVVTVDEGYAGPLSNRVEVTTEEGPVGDDSVTVSAGWVLYLPRVVRGFP